MALKKSITMQEGYSAEYWKIDSIMMVDFAKGTAQSRVLLFVNETTRQNGSNPVQLSPRSSISITSITLSGQEFQDALSTKDLRAAMYAKLKALTEFADSVDC